MKRNGIFQTLFTLSIILKGIDGVVELVGGLVFVILKKQHILDIIFGFLNYDLFKIPNETILEWVTYVSNELTTSVKILISMILICNGVIKIVLSINLLLKNLVAFPISIAFLIILLIYQIIQTFYTPSLFLNLFNVFDFIVILLIWREYTRLKKQN